MSAATERTARLIRNRALLDAEQERAAAIREVEIEYSESVLKLRDAFEADLAAALAERTERVRPAHRAYNAAVVAAERAYRVAKAAGAS